MAIFKEVWQFRSSTATWSDVYYSVNSDISAATVFPQNFLNSRLKLLSPSNVLQKIRVSDIKNPRVSAVININQNGLSSGTVPSNFTESVTCTLVSPNPPASRKLWLRGTTEGAAFRNAAGTQDVLEPQFANDLKAWFGSLNVNNYIVLKQIPVGQPGIVQQRILVADGAAGDGTTVLNMAANIFVVAGDTIIVSQTPQKDVPGLKGKFLVREVVGNNIKINYSTPDNRTIPLTSGLAKKLAYYENAVISRTRSAFAFLGGRQTKNAASGSRGARSAKRVRALA